MTFSFETTLQSKETNARLGVIHTPHGDIETPAFVPVGTQATVKSLTPEEIKTVGTQLFFVNTYHMAMRPGIELVEKMGGLHQFMKWNGPIITDSGGFQVFSLARTHQPLPNPPHQNGEGLEGPSLVKITDDGVKFRSHWDGSEHLFTPETSMEYQWKLGSDIHIAFDDCTPYPVTHDEAKKSMERTHRWAQRSVDAHQTQLITHNQKPYQALYGSIQGSVYEDLRKESATFIAGLDVDGIAIGGVSVGESKAEMTSVLDWVMPLLPTEKPRHLLGVGQIDDIFMLVAAGIDTFDCVEPTRLARAGYVYIRRTLDVGRWTLDINKKMYAEDSGPLDPSCGCYTCQTFSRAYLHHLFRVRELLGYRLATIHNLWFIHHLVTDIKESIRQNRLLELRSQWV